MVLLVLWKLLTDFGCLGGLTDNASGTVQCVDCDTTDSGCLADITDRAPGTVQCVDYDATDSGCLEASWTIAPAQYTVGIRIRRMLVALEVFMDNASGTVDCDAGDSGCVWRSHGQSPWHSSVCALRYDGFLSLCRYHGQRVGHSTALRFATSFFVPLVKEQCENCLNRLMSCV